MMLSKPQQIFGGGKLAQHVSADALARLPQRQRRYIFL